MSQSNLQPTPVRETTVDAVHPYVVFILTTSFPAATALAGIGQIFSGILCAAGGCAGSVLLVITARVIDSIKDKRPRVSKEKLGKL